MKREIKEIPMLWKPFLPKTGLVGLTGSSDTGKSTLLRQLCLAVCIGRKQLLGHPLNPKHHSAIYISTEDCEDAIAASIGKQLNNLQPKDAAGLKFIFNQDDPIKTACNILENEKADVLIIDAWADLFSGNINDITQTRRELNKLKKIASKHGCLVIILHHTVKNSEYSKPDKNKLNGSQGIEASLRALLELRPGTGTERILSILKGNYIPTKVKNTSIVLDFNEELLLFRSTGETVDKNSIVESRQAFRRNDQLVNTIKELRERERLSFTKIRERLIKDHPGVKLPSLSSVKNLYEAARQNAA
jgi:RecA-family ATPase